MFGGHEIFAGIHQHMRRRMQEMDRMINGVMDPFGIFDSNMAAIDGDNSNSHRSLLLNPFDGILNTMADFYSMGLNNPDSHVFANSTSLTFDGTSSQPRIVEQTIRKVGNVKETCHSVRTGNNGPGDRMRIEHSIGDQSHLIEKQRGQSGHIKSKEQFVNLNETEAEEFDKEFSYRIRNNLGMRPYRMRALNHGRNGEERYIQAEHSRGLVPIITLPDDEHDESEDEGRFTNLAPHGVIIEDVTDEFGRGKGSSEDCLERTMAIDNLSMRIFLNLYSCIPQSNVQIMLYSEIEGFTCSAILNNLNHTNRGRK